MEPTPFGTLLKRYRVAAGLTQEALAERASLSTRAISDLERGLSRVPRYDTLDLLTTAMSLSAEQRAELFAAARPPLPGDDTKAAPLQVLPFPPTALLGREQEVTQALDLLQARGVRLLTLTGPGGVGKTRLALELAHTLRAGFADGLAWIDLTALRDPSLVPQTVAQVLGLHEQADHAFPEQVRAFLQDKQCLLFFDNFEHLLVSCPRLQVLVTSRAPLHLRAEQQLVLTPLTQAAAVTLYRERAQRVQPNLDATDLSRWRPWEMASRAIVCSKSFASMQGNNCGQQGEEEDYQRRHAEYYAALAEEAERMGSGQGNREAHLELESANGRAALYWAYERSEGTLGLRLATWFGLFWITRGQMSEANLWLSRMLALGEARGAQATPPPPYAAERSIAHRVSLCTWAGETAPSP